MSYQRRFEQYAVPVVATVAGVALAGIGLHLLSKSREDRFRDLPEAAPFLKEDVDSHYDPIHRRRREDDVLRRRMNSCDGNFIPFDTPQSLEEISKNRLYKGSEMFVAKVLQFSPPQR